MNAKGPEELNLSRLKQNKRDIRAKVGARGAVTQARVL